MRITAALMTLSFLSCLIMKAQPGTSPAKAEYKLVWSDEFNSEGAPDSSKWRFENGFVRNNEARHPCQFCACE